MRNTIKYSTIGKDIQILNSKQASQFIGNSFRRLDHEETWIILLDNANHPIVKKLCTIGTIDTCLIDIRRIVKNALMYNATGVILMHNHLSNYLSPSPADIKQTERLKTACNLFDIHLLDHLIVGDKEYFSFSEQKKDKYC